MSQATDTLNAIEAKHLRRIYKPRTTLLHRQTKEICAVDDVSFSIKRGELFGILGPNGAGKTTIIKMLTTLLIPSAGSAQVLGYDVVKNAQEIRPQIGFIFGGERGLYWRLSAYDNLVYFSNLYHIPPEIRKQRIPYLLELVGLNGREKEKVQGYSKGMKQRLHIARALLHDPHILFFDEPTLGLDPVGARMLRQLVRNLQQENKTILLTTHYMFEADELCQRIAIVNHGHIVAQNTPAGLKLFVQNEVLLDIETFAFPDTALSQLRSMDAVTMVSVEQQEQKQIIHIQLANNTQTAPLIGSFQEMGLQINHLTVREPTLEDAYVKLVEGQ